MNDTEKDANIPAVLCIKKEQHDPSEEWLAIKEESIEPSAQADDECEYKSSPSLLLPPKQESGDGSIPNSLNKTSVCKGTNFKVYVDGQVKREDIEYNASCDTTRMHQSASLLAPIEQVFVEDLPNSDGERTSTCEKLGTGISREEASGSDDNQEDLKLEDDDYLSENSLEIKEEIPTYNAPSDVTCDAQSPSLWPLPDGEGNSVERKLPKNEEKPFGCDLCEKAFDRRSKLVDHMRVHTGEKPFKCDLCNKAFTQKSTLGHHMRLHSNDRPFACDRCSKAFTQKSKLNEHMRVHTNEKPFLCEVCNKAFTHSSSLTKHMRVHTKERPYTCDICSKGFTQKPHLTEHMLIHTREWPFTCNVCNKSFSRKKTLVEHMRLHAKESPFTCNVCNNAFTRKATLLEHMRVHTKEKPFVCDVCQKTFARRTTLSEHMRVHSNERPFTCDVCKKAFARMSNLRVHMKIHTQDRPLTYDI